MRYFLDTNIFLRFLTVDDRNAHESCKELFDLVNRRKIKVLSSSIVLAEIVWVLQSFYKFPKEQVIEVLRVFHALGISFDDRMHISTALTMYESHNVKFVDALIASHPLLQQKTISIISYDKDFDVLHVTRITPEDLVKKFL